MPILFGFITGNAIDNSVLCNKINEMRDKANILLEDIEANKLPSLPHVLVKLLQACRDENTCFDILSNIISHDAALCSKVIKAANSPVYGRAQHLNSLKHTLMFLGLDTIKSIAITASIKQFFSEYSNQKTHFLKAFWQHSLSCATIARSLAELTSYPYTEEAYISGMLHDIGKLMIEPKMDAQYRAFDHSSYPADEILQSEEEALGINHPELAAIMLEKWNMPDVICDAVRYHHVTTDEIQQAHQLAKIVHLASLLASNTNDVNSSIKTEAAIRLFDLSESITEDIVKKGYEEARTIAASMDIDISDDEGIEKKDEEKQIQLAQEVRDTALVQNSQACISIDSNVFFKSIQQSVNLLFGINSCVLLQFNESQQALTIADHQHITDSRLLEALKIELSTNCIITDTLINHKINDSFSAQQSSSLSILDKQIAHGLKTEGFISLPISQTGHNYGVLLLGTSYKHAAAHLENKKLLLLFTNNLACKILQHFDYKTKLNNITEHNNEQFLKRAEKVIHETNNPLAVIRNYLHLLSQKLDSNDSAQSELKTIKQEIDRIGNIILHCKDTMDADINESSDISINNVVSELVHLFNSSLFITHKIKSTLKLDKNLNNINSDKDLIKQIITNLIKNSVEAIQENGEINITTGNININGRNYVELKLNDTGPGISPEVMKNLYKPIASTKGKDHSGLGLSITKNLVERLHGSISCITKDSGTTFSVQFPVKN